MRQGRAGGAVALHPLRSSLAFRSPRAGTGAAGLARRATALGLSPTCRGDVAEADQGTGQVQQGLE